MANIKYISIKSVLYDLSTNLPEGMWNEALMLEWASKALLKMNHRTKLEDSLALRQIKEHTFRLPNDAKYVTQIAYKSSPESLNADYINSLITLPNSLDANDPESLPYRFLQSIHNLPVLGWSAMRAASNSFHLSVNQVPSLVPNRYYYSDVRSSHEYSITPDGCVVTSLREGWAMISYKRVPSAPDGSLLIPDNENLKDAIFHYCMYRYWLSKRAIKEEGAASEAEFHLSMFEVLAAKSAALITQDELEEIKAYRDRLVPRQHLHSQFFIGLGSPTPNPMI